MIPCRGSVVRGVDACASSGRYGHQRRGSLGNNGAGVASSCKLPRWFARPRRASLHWLEARWVWPSPLLRALWVSACFPSGRYGHRGGVPLAEQRRRCVPVPASSGSRGPLHAFLCKRKAWGVWPAPVRWCLGGELPVKGGSATAAGLLVGNGVVWCQFLQTASGGLRDLTELLSTGWRLGGFGGSRALGLRWDIGAVEVG